MRQSGRVLDYAAASTLASTTGDAVSLGIVRGITRAQDAILADLHQPNVSSISDTGEPDVT